MESGFEAAKLGRGDDRNILGAAPMDDDGFKRRRGMIAKRSEAGAGLSVGRFHRHSVQAYCTLTKTLGQAG